MPDPFSWHPEPELIGYRDPETSRAALEALGSAVWGASLDYLYDEGFRRPVIADSYEEMRARFFGDANAPSPAPTAPATSEETSNACASVSA